MQLKTVAAGYLKSETNGMGSVEKILCVDDYGSILRLIEAYLAEHFQVAFAVSPEEGLPIKVSSSGCKKKLFASPFDNTKRLKMHLSTSPYTSYPPIS